MKHFRFFFISTLLLLLSCPAAFSQTITGSLGGRVLDRVSQQPLSAARVLLSDSSLQTLTDSSGSFRLRGIPAGTYSVSVFHPDKAGLTLYNVVISTGNEQTLTIELERVPEKLSEVVVRSGRRSARAGSLETPLSVQRLTAEEIRSNPGGNFDISRVIQALPGVGGGVAGAGYRNDIVIRGGAPNENVFYLDGIEVPVINHFQTQGSSGGPQGLLNVSFIEDVRLSTSAFDARYDNALSSVFQFRQKTGNPNKLQGNVRLSGTELAVTGEGPLGKKTTFLASARRSYLEVLFTLLDLPIRPNYWDFQTKVTHRISDKTTLSFIALGAIDEFAFATLKTASPEKLYTINSNPFINQWNYTGGLSLRQLIPKGYLNVALSRNSFDNDIVRYENNETKLPAEQTLSFQSRETENKLRIDVNQTISGWKIAYGVSAQLAEYSNETFSVVRRTLRDSTGAVVQPEVVYNFNSPLEAFWRFGAFAQAGRRFFGEALGVSLGLRSDVNTFTTDGLDAAQTLSPRLALSYAVAPKWNINASAGRYYKLSPYTILGFADNAGRLVNKDARYTRSDHLVGGLEYLPNDELRFTLEGFYKRYTQVAVSRRTGIPLSNLGGDFTVLGNEPVSTDGEGRAYGAELFAQQKLTKRFFGIAAFTWYVSEYRAAGGAYVPSSFANDVLLSLALGYKAGRAWEIGLKYRYQGGQPYTPYDEAASRVNYLATGRGTLDYTRLNSLRLGAFQSADIRVDKKWNFRKLSLDVYLDITNFLRMPGESAPDYTFQRTTDNSAFLTTNGAALQPDGSNAVPIVLENRSVLFVPTVGFIVEF